MPIRKQPYHLLFIGGILVFCLSFFASEQEIEIHLHDRYTITPLKLILLAFSVLLFLLWLVYRFLQKKCYSYFVTLIHSVLTTLGITYLSFAFWKQHRAPDTAPTVVYRFESIRESVSGFDSQLTIIIITLLLLQILFVLNLLGGFLFKKPAKKK